MSTPQSGSSRSAVQTEHGWPLAASTVRAFRSCPASARHRRHQALAGHIQRVHTRNYGVFGPRKVWLTLNREGVPVARCTVQRLMRQVGLKGVVPGRRVRTTVPDARAVRPTDLVQRQFTADAPNRLWVADFTYVPSWAGMVYVAFVVDAYARRILGWRADTTTRTSLVLDAWRWRSGP